MNVGELGMLDGRAHYKEVTAALDKRGDGVDRLLELGHRVGVVVIRAHLLAAPDEKRVEVRWPTYLRQS